jgi:hypothetical protein
VSRKKETNMTMFRVQRADDCIWLLDERAGEKATVEIHMVPEQASLIGKALVEASEHVGTEPFVERFIG